MNQKAGELENKPGQQTAGDDQTTDPNQTDDKNAGAGSASTNTNQEKGKEPEISDDVKKLIQSKEDTIRTKYAKEKATLQKELDDLKKAQMTDDQKKSFEEKQKADELARKEQELIRKEQGILAGELFQTKGLPVDLRAYAVGNSEEETKENVTKFETIWKRELKKAMEAEMSKLGRKPNSGSSDNDPAAGDIDAQIRQAEQKGDWRKAMALKFKFQSTLPRGKRLKTCNVFTSCVLFQSTPLHEGRQDLPRDLQLAVSFQSTPLHEGRLYLLA